MPVKIIKRFLETPEALDSPELELPDISESRLPSELQLPPESPDSPIQQDSQDSIESPVSQESPDSPKSPNSIQLKRIECITDLLEIFLPN